jgi:hypothetical protein
MAAIAACGRGLVILLIAVTRQALRRRCRFGRRVNTMAVATACHVLGNLVQTTELTLVVATGAVSHLGQEASGVAVVTALTGPVLRAEVRSLFAVAI